MKKMKEIIIEFFAILIILKLCFFVGSVSSASVGPDALLGASRPSRRPVCVYHMSDKVQSPGDNLSGGDELIDDGGAVICDSPSDYCFSFWRVVPPPSAVAVNDSSRDTSLVMESHPGFSWLARGCFKNAHLCDRESCVATERERDNSFFCCCKGDKCNRRISFKEASTPAPSPEDVLQAPVGGDSPLDKASQALYMIAGCLLFAVICCAFVVYFKRHLKTKASLAATNGPYPGAPTSPCIDLGSLKFLDVIGQGRYGTAVKAILGGEEEVAVKLFFPSHKYSFNNEKYIYSLPLMEHPNLLSYFGGGEMTGPDGNQYLGLVLSYCPGGNLSSYLRENTLDWGTFCRVVVTTARGLAHLHSDIRKGGATKPCVSHRDFNTRNILLKEDMSCVVSDLGFAIHTQGAKFYANGEEQIAEMASLTDVGTLRYMAPEVLEGAVNLRDCETSLKQIDIYSLGLVLWEVAHRCHDLYQGAQPPDYELPFQAEIGLHPSFEQMQVLVVRNKARPLFPHIWKDTSPAIKQLKETIEDCWDNDAEARLSSMCVERRLVELPKLWSRYKASLGLNGISPTMNPPSTGALFSRLDAASPFIQNELRLKGSCDDGYHDDGDAIGAEDAPGRGDLWCPPRGESSASENTVETTVQFSPSSDDTRGVAPPTFLGKNHAMEAVAVRSFPLAPLQPHQGRNPCMERNTVNNNNDTAGSASCITSASTSSGGGGEGGPFLHSSSKYPPPHNLLRHGRNNINNDGVDSDFQNDEHLVPLLMTTSSPSSAPATTPLSPVNVVSTGPAVTAPALSGPHVNHHHAPIPYLQNETRQCLPKLHNVAVENRINNNNHRGNREGGVWWKVLKSLRHHLPFLPGGGQQPFSRGGENPRKEDELGILIGSPSCGGGEVPEHPAFSASNCPPIVMVASSNGGRFTVVSNRDAPGSPPYDYSCTTRPPLHFAPSGLPVTTQTRQPLHLVRPYGGVGETHTDPKLQTGLSSTHSPQGSKDSGINKSSENSNNSFMDSSDSSLDKVQRRRPESLRFKNKKGPIPRCLLAPTEGGIRSVPVVVATTSDDEERDTEDSDGMGGPPRKKEAPLVKLRKPRSRVKSPPSSRHIAPPPVTARLSLDCEGGRLPTATNADERHRLLSRSLPSFDTDDVGTDPLHQHHQQRLLRQQGQRQQNTIQELSSGSSFGGSKTVDSLSKASVCSDEVNGSSSSSSSSTTSVGGRLLLLKKEELRLEEGEEEEEGEEPCVNELRELQAQQILSMS